MSLPREFKSLFYSNFLLQVPRICMQPLRSCKFNPIPGFLRAFSPTHPSEVIADSPGWL